MPRWFRFALWTRCLPLISAPQLHLPQMALPGQGYLPLGRLPATLTVDVFGSAWSFSEQPARLGVEAKLLYWPAGFAPGQVPGGFHSAHHGPTGLPACC